MYNPYLVSLCRVVLGLLFLSPPHDETSRFIAIAGGGNVRLALLKSLLGLPEILVLFERRPDLGEV